nr:MAG TPA: Epidermal growth factor receptor substrate [Caudoviricetes sp.]
MIFFLLYFCSGLMKKCRQSPINPFKSYNKPMRRRL